MGHHFPHFVPNSDAVIFPEEHKRTIFLETSCSCFPKAKVLHPSIEDTKWTTKSFDLFNPKPRRTWSANSLNSGLWVATQRHLIYAIFQNIWNHKSHGLLLRCWLFCSCCAEKSWEHPMKKIKRHKGLDLHEGESK